jgi:hypothetical protein
MRSILDAFTIFPFAIVLSLALGEAFKLVVSEDGQQFIAWQKLYALASFLLLILPFYQGMNRYLLITYGEQAPAPKPDAVFLVIDGTSFMLESALFFVMSRTLGIDKWQRFYWVVFTLLAVDSAWGATVLMHATPPASEVIKAWLTLNIGTAVFILVFIGCGRYRIGAEQPPLLKLHVLASVGTFAMLVRTIWDYKISWGFYFH